MGQDNSLSGWGWILGLAGVALLAGGCMGGGVLFALRDLDLDLELPEVDFAEPEHAPAPEPKRDHIAEAPPAEVEIAKQEPGIPDLHAPSPELEALVAAYGQGLLREPQELSAQLQELCELQVMPACGAPTGLGSLSLSAAQECASGHVPSCVVYGWERTQLDRYGKRDGLRGEVAWSGVGTDIPDTERDIEGADAFQQACEAGEPMGCAELGRAYGWGVGRAYDTAQAALLFEASCEAGLPIACAWWGDALADSGDQAGAQALYERSCEAGSGEGCRAASIALDADAGRMDLLARGCEELHDARACVWHFENLAGAGEARGAAGLERICSDVDRVGMPYACDVLAGLYLGGVGVEQDATKAAELNRRACEQGDRDGCIHLGYRFQDGRGVRADPLQALGFLRRGCDWGQAEGCRGLAEMRFASEQEDPLVPTAKEALAAMEKGCELGDGESCNRLALVLVDGDKGVEAQSERVGDLHARACELDFAWGCYNQAYWDDSAREGSEPWAAERYLQACELGLAQGCLAYSERLRDGRGVYMDYGLGSEYRIKACALGLEEACAP